MARAAVLERLIPPRVSIVWHEATVTEVVVESRRARTIVFAIPDWPGHRAGQHLDVRLTAEDGYTAERSYSLSSAPEDGVVAVTVDEIEDGEVSPYLVEEVRAGDVLEVRGVDVHVHTAALVVVQQAQCPLGQVGAQPQRGAARHSRSPGQRLNRALHLVHRP